MEAGSCESSLTLSLHLCCILGYLFFFSSLISRAQMPQEEDGDPSTLFFDLHHFLDRRSESPKLVIDETASQTWLQVGRRITALKLSRFAHDDLIMRVHAIRRQG